MVGRPIQLPVWLYRLQLLYMEICLEYEQDYTAALVCIRDMHDYADSRGDHPMCWIAKLQSARMAMVHGDDAVAKTFLTELAQTFKLPMTDREAQEQQLVVDAKNRVRPKGQEKIRWVQQLELLSSLPKHAVLSSLILLSLYLSHIGEPRAAKSTIKRAHELLDLETRTLGELEGFALVSLSDDSKR